MATKNIYYRHSRISEAKFMQLMRCFAMDLTATDTAALTAISVWSVNTIFLKIRHRIAEACELASPLQSAVEVDESYSGAHRVRGKRGHIKPASMLHSDGYPDWWTLASINIFG